MFLRSRILYVSMFVVLVIMLIGVADAQAAASQGQTVQTEDTPELLQFTSSGHVLGFQAGGVYVATGSHMLRESFAGTNGAAPQGDRASSKEGRGQPMGKVSYPGLWEGITLTYDSPPGGILRSTYHVEPGADPGQMGLRYNVPVQLDVSGNLVFKFETGTMTASAPVAWQEVEGKRITVDVAFRLDASQSIVHFSLGAHNPAFPLFIDPTLAWNTFMGSLDEDKGQGIAVDGSGNVYVTGSGVTTWGTPVNPYTGSMDAFVAKLNNNGVLLWNTFMGSGYNDVGMAIAVDGSGNVYVAGDSYNTWGSPINAWAGDRDAFVAKLDSSGVSQWNTFMGSGDDDYGWAIALDGSGNVYVAGGSSTTWGSPVNAHTGGNYDAFVAKLNSSGVSVWNTFMGSTQIDGSEAIAVDGSGDVYVAGESSATWGNPVNPHAGGNYDAFVAKLNSSGVSVWNTFMGSSNDDRVKAIAVDGSGNVHVAGFSNATWGSPVNAHTGGNYDAFVAKLDSSGVSVWNTFMGSNDTDYGRAIAVDGRGNVYVAGISYDTWGSPVIAYAANADAFAAKLDDSGVRQWNTFMGATPHDYSYAIAVDGKENVYVAGHSYATWGNPVNAHTEGGNFDVFVAKFLKGILSPGIPLLLLDSE